MAEELCWCTWIDLLFEFASILAMMSTQTKAKAVQWCGLMDWHSWQHRELAKATIVSVYRQGQICSFRGSKGTRAGTKRLVAAEEAATDKHVVKTAVSLTADTTHIPHESDADLKYWHSTVLTTSQDCADSLCVPGLASEHCSIAS